MDAPDQARWEVERGFREREVGVKERELELRSRAESASRWRSPLVVAILAAAVAAGGNALVAYTNDRAQTHVEAQKAESARILEMIKTGNPDKAAANLKFLLDAGLITSRDVRSQLTAYLARRRPGTGVALPSAAGTSVSASNARLTAQFEGFSTHKYLDPLGRWEIGVGHVLTPEELRTNTIVINGRRVDISHGITREAALELLQHEIAPVRAEVVGLLTVKLSENRLSALTDFAYNVGLPALRERLLGLVNGRRFAEVPAEIMRWDRVGGVVFAGQLERRKAEVALWKKG